MPPAATAKKPAVKGPGPKPKSPLGEVEIEEDVFSDDDLGVTAAEPIKTSKAPAAGPAKRGPKAKSEPAPVAEVEEELDLDLDEDIEIEVEPVAEAPAKRPATVKTSKAPASAPSASVSEEAIQLILALDAQLKNQGNTLAGFLKPINENLNEYRKDVADMQAEVKNLQLSVKEALILLNKVTGKLDESHAQLLVEVQHLKQNRSTQIKQETSVPSPESADDTEEEDEEESEEEDTIESVLEAMGQEPSFLTSVRAQVKKYSGKDIQGIRLAQGYAKQLKDESVIPSIMKLLELDNLIDGKGVLKGHGWFSATRDRG